LEENGINSDNFYSGGYKTGCIFSPNNVNSGNINSPINKNELESLGFTYLSGTNGYYTSTGDAGICNFNGCCVECTTIGCSSTVNRACQNGGYLTYVITSYNACWTGNYNPTILTEMSNNMVCEVSGEVTEICSGAPIGSDDRCQEVSSHTFEIQGEVSYNEGFVCNVNKSELFDRFKTLNDGRTVNLIGFEGIVLFREITERTYYRLLNNQCSPIQMLESDKTSNDYLTLQECQNKIIICKTSADVNCDNFISRTELGISITKFLTGELSRSELGEIIQEWSLG
jgi:hypothetical protein